MQQRPADLKAPPPFNDPPPNGYSYQNPPNAVKLRVYYNMFAAASSPLSLAAHQTTTTMDFFDAPAVSGCLSGNPDGKTGTKLGFTTHLVGIVGLLPGAGVFDTGIGFSYTTTFNGTSGGVAVLNSAVPADPGSGTGGIAVTAYNTVTSYKYPPSLGVTAINGVTVASSASNPPILLGRDSVSVQSTGLAYSRATRNWTETVTITNVGSAAITGPFQLVLDSLSAGVTVVNSTSSFGGWPYVTVPAASSLQPGESAEVTITMQAPTTTAITFSPVPYAGSF